jgi:hypothetical protein
MIYLAISLITFLIIILLTRRDDPITTWTSGDWGPVLLIVIIWPLFIIYLISLVCPPMPDVKAFFIKERHIYDFKKVIKEYKEIKRKKLRKAEVYRKLFRLKRID